MWQKALTIIPSVTKSEWDTLDIISKWLISTRAAVLAMTLTSSLLAGLLAWGDNSFNFLPWLVMTLGLLLAHASNNLFNDYTDYIRGVDQKNYYRAVYGLQPLVQGFMTKGQHLTYFAFSGLMALGCGIYLIWQNESNWNVWALLLSGAFFLLFYTWPLKYIAMGEIAVLAVWGPLMVGGGYYVITHRWDWNVVIASLVYALGVTTVIFGKHIDKIIPDREKNIHTLPSVLGEKISRQFVIGMIVSSFALLGYLVAIKYFTPIVLLPLLSLPRLRKILPAFLNPKPAERPENFPQGQGGWPLFFAPLAFWYYRSFGTFFVLGVAVDGLLRIVLPFIQR